MVYRTIGDRRMEDSAMPWCMGELMAGAFRNEWYHGIGEWMIPTVRIE